MSITYCKVCVTPSTRPGITFDINGRCNACQWAEKKQCIDWGRRFNELKDMIQARLQDIKHGSEYDCVMTISGGKDSTFQAWFAKEILNLKVLGVRIEPLMPTSLAEHNVRNIASSVGIDVISVINNKEVFSHLSKECFVRYGNPYIPFYYNIYCQTARIALDKNIPFLIIGEDGDTEYGGNSTPTFQNLGGDNIHLRAGGGRSNFVPSYRWNEWGLNMRDLSPYIEPEGPELSSSRIKRFFLSSYIPWKDNINMHTTLNRVGGFSTALERTRGTYTFGAGIDDKLDEIYLWLLWPKFGFHRATKTASNDIREGKLSRSGAIELVRLYEGEFPWHVFDEFLGVFQINEDTFWDIVSSFVGDEENLRRIAETEGRDPESVLPAWKKIGERKWRHLNPIHGQERILELPLSRSKVRAA